MEPWELFGRWFELATESEIEEPNAMVLSTLKRSGSPASRVVLLKGYDRSGFVFYTNYESAKGRELQHSSCAALLFWWAPLQKQVRIEGTVEKVSAAESDQYFESRPKGSRIGAWVSDQSQPIADRQVMEEKLRELEAQYSEEKIPRPPHWGGYRVTPTRFEFWQGRSNRLHDRLSYQLEAGRWHRARLSP